MSEVNEKTPLLEVRNLRKLFAGKSSFFQKDKSWIKAVDDVSFTLNPKETLGVRMGRVRKQLFLVRQLYHMSQIHNHDTV